MFCRVHFPPLRPQTERLNARCSIISILAFYNIERSKMVTRAYPDCRFDAGNACKDLMQSFSICVQFCYVRNLVTDKPTQNTFPTMEVDPNLCIVKYFQQRFYCFKNARNAVNPSDLSMFTSVDVTGTRTCMCRPSACVTSSIEDEISFFFFQTHNKYIIVRGQEYYAGP